MGSTTYYGWTKPDVAGSADIWGDQINTDLVGIDSIVHGIDVRISDNRIVNGNFSVNQRAFVSGTALPSSPTVANGYGHDRWKAGASGCTYTFTVALPDTTITITANTLTQIIEAGMIEGGVYTLSWAGTAQARVYQGTPTGSYAASPITTGPLTAGTNTIVEFNVGTMTRVKLEIGSVATPFNRQSTAKSVVDCQRYYQVLPGLIFNCWQVAGSGIYGSFPYNTVMRANPTAVFTGVTAINASGLAANALNTNTAILYAVTSVTGYTQVAATMQLSAEL